MPTYTYKAVNANGQEFNETLSASSRANVLDQIFAKNLTPLSVEEAKAASKATSRISLRPGWVSKRDVEAFTRELSNLLAAGVPLSRSLSILSREASNPAAKKQWAEVHDSVSEGLSLAEALGQWPNHFLPFILRW